MFVIQVKIISKMLNCIKLLKVKIVKTSKENKLILMKIIHILTGYLNFLNVIIMIFFL